MILTAQKAQLLERAHRILVDGKAHSRQARRWAELELAMPQEDEDARELRTHRFTPAEVLLAHQRSGAMP